MAHKHNLLIVAVAAAGLGVLGTYAYFAHRAAPGPVPAAGAPAATPGARPAGAAPGGPPGGFAIGVEAVPVAAVTMEDAVTAVGSLKSNEAVVLRSEIAGRIAAINFRDGQPVRKGDVLIGLDASTQQAEMAQAEANLALARANYKRNEDLFEKKFVSERAKDESAANLKVVEAAAKLAQARLAKAQIRAPFSGIMGIRNVSVGDYVKEGQDLVNLEDISQLKVDFRLPEALLPQVKKGQTVEVTSDSLPNRSFNGTVDAIDPLVDAAGRAVSVRARLPNDQGVLRPGMFARVRLALGGARQVLAVPEEALVPAGNDQFVFRVKDGKAERVRVQTGMRRAAKVEIVAGLKPGDLVVTAGQLKIREGAPVKVISPAPAVPADGKQG